MSNKRRSQSAIIAYLHGTARCRWISRQTFNLLPGHARKRQILIGRLQEAGYISCKKMTNGRRYKLTDAGYLFLFKSNPERHRQEKDYRVAGNEYDMDKIRRISLLGEAMVMMEQAGYSVHPDDKPAPQSLSRLLVQEGVSPASIANQTEHRPCNSPTFNSELQTVPHSLPRIPGISVKNEFRYIEQYCYFTEDERKHGDNLYLDTSIYRKRSTPIGCYYTAKEIRRVLEEETISTGGEIGDLDAFARYTKISGLLFTSGGSFRVYTTERTAPVIRKNGESNMNSILESWCGYIYGRSLEELYGNRPRSPVRASILFGDKSYQAAVSVIRESFKVLLSPNSVIAKRKKDRGGDTCNFNVKDMGEILYLPVIRESLPLLSIMIYPEWERWVRKIGTDVSKHRAEMQPVTQLGIYDAVLEDRSRFACMISLDLRRMMQIIQDLDEESPSVHLFAMEWQRPFFTLLTTLLEETRITKFDVEYGRSDLLISAARKLQRYFGHEGIW